VTTSFAGGTRRADQLADPRQQSRVASAHERRYRLERIALDALAREATADARAAFEHGDATARVREAPGRREPGETRANHEHVTGRCRHAR
jgi:hypothetical protein